MFVLPVLPKNKLNTIYLISIGLFMLALVPYLLLAFYCHPIADDFDYTHTAKVLGYTDAIVNKLNTSNGRYSSILVLLANPMVHDWWAGYRAIPWVLIILTLVAVCFALNAITSGYLQGLRLVALGLFFTGLYLFNMPSLAEGIYWLSGSATYQLGNIFGLTFLGFLVRYNQGRWLLHHWVHAAIMVILLFFSCGFNETLLLMLIMALMLAAFITYRQSRSLRMIGLLLLVAFGLLALAFFLPGNQIRQSLFPNSHNFGASLWGSALQSGRFGFHFVVNVPLLLSSLLFIPLSNRLAEEIPAFAKGVGTPVWVSSALLVLILLICTFPPYWATGILGQHRTLNVAWFFFIPAWFLNLHNWLQYLKRRVAIPSRPTSSAFYILLIILITASLATTGNGYNTATELLSGQAKQYDTELEERYNVLRTCANAEAETCVLPALSAKPKSLFVVDIQPGSNWINRSYGKHFGAKGITLEHTSK